MRLSLKQWTASGSPWVWMNAGAVTLSLIMVFGLLALIAVRGLSHFWPSDLLLAEYRGPDNRAVMILGEVVDTEAVPAEQLRDAGQRVPDTLEFADRSLLKVGNRDLSGADFRWVLEINLSQRSYPENAIAIERREWGNFYGFLEAVLENGREVATGDRAWDELETRLVRALSLYKRIHAIEKSDIGAINYGLERLRLRERRLELDDRLTPAALAEIQAEREALQKGYEGLQAELTALYAEINRDSVRMRSADDRTQTIAISKIVDVYRPNAMSTLDKSLFYLGKLWEFVADDPREANTEGGIFPAIYGTVLMVLIMSVMVTPLGVVAAVYLREYAHQGVITRIIRISVNNLAGVPSIVYGVFGLGFLVYFVGGSIDQAFFPEALPSPTFGTGGLLWASITLAILTLPVVIVATEEGLARIPRTIREGSLALGATKAETLWRVVLPMASPAMMTGVILAIARAAGEVAPLMLVGVVKLAPSLPLDGNYPYLHLDQKFMHLGFHIYDVGFQSPNVEAARPLVYATSLLLVLVIALLNLSAVAIHNRLREKYKAI